jgi:hypothetical protein
MGSLGAYFYALVGDPNLAREPYSGGKLVFPCHYLEFTGLGLVMLLSGFRSACKPYGSDIKSSVQNGQRVSA